jgi:hypothetical protein
LCHCRICHTAIFAILLILQVIRYGHKTLSLPPSLGSFLPFPFSIFFFSLPSSLSPWALRGEREKIGNGISLYTRGQKRRRKKEENEKEKEEEVY